VNLIQKQLQNKTVEAETFSKELQNSKAENHKLREKVRGLVNQK
jgi:hypothetical protein